MYALKYFVDAKDFQILSCDTDSVSMSLSHMSGEIDKVIKPELKEEWEKVRGNYLPINDTVEEKKRSGIFKIDFLGVGASSLNAKTACYWSSTETKFAAKGLQKNLNFLRHSLMY